MDLLDKRVEAVDTYRSLLSAGVDGEVQDEAKRGLREPFRRTRLQD